MDIKNIKKLVSDISLVKGVYAVYLFGSCATGKQKPYSDIDICVITDDSITNQSRNEILTTSSKKIDTHILSDLPLYIQFRVFRDGKPLFINSPQNLSRSKFQIIRRYQDFESRLQKYYRRILS